MKLSQTKTYNPNFEAYKLGVTGNIASGESTVQRYFENIGVKCINVDEVCHKLYESDKPLIEKVKNMFGRFGFHELDNDDVIDRKKIATIVFENPEIRKELESIVHPEIEKCVDSFVKENENEKYIAIFSPLIYETGTEKNYDKILFIKIGPQLQLKNLMAGNPLLTEETAQDIINSQMSQKIKEKKADFVINNSFDSETTIDQVEDLYDELDRNSAWRKKSKLEIFKNNLKKYFVEYPERINYTWRHKKAYLETEKEYLGKNTFRGYLHDLDKLFMHIIGVPQETAHKIHVATAPHHIRNGHVKYPLGAVIDWQCAHKTKPKMPRNARDHYERSCPKMPEIEEILNRFNIRSVIND